LLPIILISGIAWFGCVAINMSGESLEFETLKTVWGQTEFGTAFKIRLMLWLAAVLMAFLSFFNWRPAFQKPAQLVLSGSLLGSLAWAGHGLEGSLWHLSADVLHLLAAGFWPAGLLPLALLLNKLRHVSDPEDWSAITVIVRRFSAVSLGCVALLAVTGIINSWFLVPSFSSLFTQPYGLWLSAKIILFCLTVIIGAVNLLRLKPRLLHGELQSQPVAIVVTQLRRNVLCEIILGTVIVVIVAILGILPP
jgi:putative copper resistance protein D